MEFNSTKLTPLGEHVFQHDPGLSSPATQWLMHYHLSAPHGPGPRFWHELVLGMPHWGQPFGRPEVSAHIAQTTSEAGADLKARSIDSTATVFLGSYTKSDALGPLGILTDGDAGHTVQTPDPPPLGALAYALAHYWEGRFGDMPAWHMDELSKPGEFGDLFFLSSFGVNRALRQLARKGILELWMAAPPFQVTRPPRSELLLKDIYVLS